MSSDDASTAKPLVSKEDAVGFPNTNVDTYLAISGTGLRQTESSSGIWPSIRVRAL